MSQDFARKKRVARARPAPKSNVPGWVWLFTGTVLGAFIMFLVHLSGLKPAPSPTANTPSAATSKAVDQDKEVHKPKFDFYELLKESEVVVSGQSNQPDGKTEAQLGSDFEYVLQVGSFRNEKDADQLRAQLLLMNMDAYMEKVTVANSGRWHRVMVGPFQSRSKLAKARSTLVSHDIDPLTLKRKLGG